MVKLWLGDYVVTVIANVTLSKIYSFGDTFSSDFLLFCGFPRVVPLRVISVRLLARMALFGCVLSGRVKRGGGGHIACFFVVRATARMRWLALV